jgi:hypothetical protein
MGMFLPNTINNIIPFSGALIGAYKGYYYAVAKRNIRWGTHATHVPLNVGYVGYFALFGFSFGYIVSKVIV